MPPSAASASSARASWGAGIAAQVANAGVPVLLLDIVPPGTGDRNKLADAAVARMLMTDPAPFMAPEAAKLVETGNTEDDLAAAAACDWIIEAVVERLDLKQALVPAARRAAPSRHGRELQHLDHPAGRAAGRPARGLRAGLPHHAFLQPAALHAAARSGAGPGDRPRTRGPRLGLLRPRARQEHRALQGHARLHRQPHRHLLAAARRQCRHGPRPRRRGGRCRDGAPLRHPQDGRLRPARPRRPRPHAAYRRQHDGAAVGRGRLRPGPPRQPAADPDDRRGLYGPQGQGRLLPDQPRGGKDQGIDRPRHGRLRALARRQAARSRRPRHAGPHGVGGPLRPLRLGRDGQRAGLCGRPRARDLGRPRRRRRRHAARLQLEAGPLRDAGPARSRRGGGAARPRRPAGAAAAGGRRRGQLLPGGGGRGRGLRDRRRLSSHGAARGSAAPRRRQTGRGAAAEERLGGAVGHRRRRRVFRDRHQDEQLRRGRAEAARPEPRAWWPNASRRW